MAVGSTYEDTLRKKIEVVLKRKFMNLECTFIGQILYFEEVLMEF